jgi:1,4-dihydroxy-2-naphthoate octaprenyltransferase
MQSFPSTLERWLMAARPKTLPASVAPVIVGAAIAYNESAFDLLPALAALIVALLLQIGANFANDLFDHQRGADTAERLGPTRLTASGLISPAQMRRGMLAVFGLAALTGLALAMHAGWGVIWLGAAAILGALAYTGGPLPYGYYGLGELGTFVFFGPIAVVGTYFVQAGRVSASAWWASVPIGLLVTAILVVNNLRDIETDRKVGKRTLAVRLGVNGTRIEFTLLLIVAYAIPYMAAVMQVWSYWPFLVWLSIPLGYGLTMTIWRESGRPLNRALAQAGRLALIYGLLLAAAMILDRIVPL